MPQESKRRALNKGEQKIFWLKFEEVRTISSRERPTGDDFREHKQGLVYGKPFNLWERTRFLVKWKATNRIKQG